MGIAKHSGATRPADRFPHMRFVDIKSFGRRVRGWFTAVSVVLAVIGLPALPAAIKGWGTWFAGVASWMQIHQLLLTWLSGLAAGVAVITAAAWLSARWEDAGRPNLFYIARGLWKYVRVTAIGKVRVRYASYSKGHRDGAIWMDPWVAKGKLLHIPFETFRSVHPHRFGIDLPAIYRLVFPSSDEQVDWTETVENDRRRYEGTPPQSLRDVGHHVSFVGIEVATQLSGSAGWPRVRWAFRRRPLPFCRIARMGWFVATSPHHADAKTRWKDLHAPLPTDERLPPKPDMPSGPT